MSKSDRAEAEIELLKSIIRELLQAYNLLTIEEWKARQRLHKIAEDASR